MSKSNIKVILKSPCVKTIEAYVTYYKNLFPEVETTYLPVKEKKITILKSPHVFKKAKEQFKLSVFKCILIIKGQSMNSGADRIIYSFSGGLKGINITINASTVNAVNVSSKKRLILKKEDETSSPEEK
jgi:ribosomal protein S10